MPTTIARVQWSYLLQIFSLSGLVLICFSGSPAWSEQVLKNLKQGVGVYLRTPLDGKTAQVGQVFEGVLTEDLRYKSWVLPKGTSLTGQITQVKHSKRLGRPGYVVLEVQEAALPHGQAFSIDPRSYPPRQKRIYHPETLTFPEIIFQQIPSSAAGLGASIPIQAKGKVEPLGAFPISLGVRTALGAVYGLVRPAYRGQPVAYRLTQGALNGTGIPRLVGFLGKYPEPRFNAGDRLGLFFNQDALRDLFQNTVTVEKPPASPLQPAMLPP